ncbi:hypothetical protein K502DRAFT_331739 [Neoconidiobolus thromboides FSU 785]|nr:hypothetical protein K502DRAFT_331739 [Neoconidiobolus thromboides FSU 785]
MTKQTLHEDINKKESEEIQFKYFVPLNKRPVKSKPIWKKDGKHSTFKVEISRPEDNQKDIQNMKNKSLKLVFSQKNVKVITTLPKSMSATINNWKAISMYQSMLKAQPTTKDQLWVRKDGTFDYFGWSPLGHIIVAYLSVHLKVKKEKQVISINLDNFQKEQVVRIIRARDLSNDWFENLAIDAYFEYFHYYLPIVEEERVRIKNNSLLKRVVISIGYNYIINNKLQDEVFNLLDAALLNMLSKYYFVPNIDTVTSLILISNFQALRFHRTKVWIYINSAIGLSCLLGLNRPSPKMLKLSKSQIRHRCHQWWTCCIQDKAFALTLNRPMSISPDGWRIPYPKYEIYKKQPHFPDYQAEKEIKHFASLVNLKGMAQISEIGGIIKLEFNSDKAKSNLLERKLEQILAKLQLCKSLYVKEMTEVYCNQPKWVFDICHKFLLSHSIIHNDIVIETINSFNRICGAEMAKKYEKKYLEAAASVIIACESLGESFFKYGRLFRFICLSTATVVFAKKFCYEDIGKKDENIPFDVQSYLKKGLVILEKSKVYYPITSYALNLIYSLLKPNKK